MKLHPQTSTGKVRFGGSLQNELMDAACIDVDIAVAWIRVSGLLHLQDGLTTLLSRSGTLRIVVGIDADNTSVEGLEGLLSIASPYPGKAAFFVRHNEAGPLFHPKLYVFRSTTKASVFSGSNNLTQSGLYQNEEFSVQVTCDVGGVSDKELRAYFAELTDLSSGLVKELSPTLIADLIAGGYVKNESQLKSTVRARSRRPRATKPIFGQAFVKPPKPPVTIASPVQPKGTAPSSSALLPGWHSVYLRLRMARGTQAQIPLEVARELRKKLGLAGDGPFDLISRVNASTHKISPTVARGNVNTYKFEGTPVTGDLLLQIFPIGNQLFFEFLDSADPLGAPVLQFIKDGFVTDPQTSKMTKPSSPQTSTWYRFS